MAKLSYAELKTYVSNVVTSAKLSSASFSITRDNIVGLVDKIGKIVTLDTNYQIDKLQWMNGENLEFGKTIEEWQQDLLMPQDYDPTGANALTPSDPSYRPCFYSITLGRKKFKTTIRNNEIERAVNNATELVSIVAMKSKRLQDSESAYRYEVKREILAKWVGLCEDEMDQTNATAYGSLTSSSAVGTLVKGTATQTGILVKKVASAPASWDVAVSGGYVVPLDLIKEIAKPVDDSTGEAFIKQVKDDIEIAKDLNEGHSLNGNSMGATEGLKLIFVQGVKSSLDVDTMAGAFNPEKLSLEADVEVIKNFPSADAKVFAILVDSRGARLHNSYMAMREDINGDGDFVNMTKHTEDTGYVSRNAFIRVYKTA